jgi:hypothetical protein
VSNHITRTDPLWINDYQATEPALRQEEREA